MVVDSTSFRWYMAGAALSIVAGWGGRTCNSCVKHAWAGVHSWLFRVVQTNFDIEEHWFHKVNNVAAMSRLLKTANLKTGRFHWLHDANERTGDCIQVGSIRLSTRSYSLWLLALFGVTHYIWIADDAKSVLFVGPRLAVTTFVRIANDSSNRNSAA